MNELSTTELLWKTLELALERYTALKAALPGNWPGHKKFGVTSEKLNKFQQQRLTENLEGLNLPLLLYNVECGKDQKVKEVFSSILENLNWFSREMLSKPGAKLILEPLWLDVWQSTRLWGVVSEVFYCHFLTHQNFSIDGFDRTITNSTQTADIATSFNGKRTWIDIEAHMLKPFEGTKENFRNLLEHRANTKMSAKYSKLPPNEFGVIASIYRIKSGQNMTIFSVYKEVTTPVSGQNQNVTASIYWIAVGKHGQGQHFLTLTDRTTESEIIGT